MSELEELLKQKVTFHCSRRGGGKEKRDFQIVHSLGFPLETDNIPDWVTPSLLSIYNKWNGLRIFQPSHEAEDGFRLFAINEVNEELIRLREIFEDNIELYKEETDFTDLENWLTRLVPIAEIMCSGDVFVLDTYNKNTDGECPVLFLDHEAYYGGCCDPEVAEKQAENVTEFLIKVLKDPLKFVAAHWVGDDFNEQWYPDSVSIA